MLFHHIVLMDGRDNAIARFVARTSTPDISPQHREAAAMAGGEAGLARFYDELLAVLAARPDTVVVRSVDRDIEGTHLRLRQALADVLAEPGSEPVRLSEQPNLDRKI